MTNPPDERGAELRELFFETSQELLQALNEEALKLEKAPGDEEIVRGIRRTVHTLKGDAAACGLRELSELAHQFEDALSVESAVTQTAVAEIAFAAADVFVEMIEAYRGGGKMPSTKSLSKKIHDLTAVPASGKTRRGRKPSGKTAASTPSIGKAVIAQTPPPKPRPLAKPPGESRSGPSTKITGHDQGAGRRAGGVSRDRQN